MSNYRRVHRHKSRSQSQSTGCAGERLSGDATEAADGAGHPDGRFLGMAMGSSTTQNMKQTRSYPAW